MLVRQWLRGADDLMQIGVHELVDCVDVVVVVAVRRQLNIAYCDNILMMQVTQQLDFAKRAPSVGEVFEGVADFLDGHLLSRHLVLRGTHDAIGPLPDRFDWDVLVVNLEDASPNNVAGLAGHVAFLAHRQGQELTTDTYTLYAGSVPPSTERRGMLGGKRRCARNAHGCG
eukprot:364577-Chlamydomonas_euryale.AAC.12